MIYNQLQKCYRKYAKCISIKMAAFMSRDRETCSAINIRTIRA